mmetsp:Transcript_1971/g.3488  ORF Transcript_1971/g.3488 Transcript_1971/m.3488 type:complete len:597 (-) Transcript_1971:742-2532(-)
MARQSQDVFHAMWKDILDSKTNNRHAANRYMYMPATVAATEIESSSGLQFFQYPQSRIYDQFQFDPQNLPPNSDAVNYFHNLYRWGKPSTIDFSNSTTTVDYVVGLLNTAIPWWVVGAIIAFTCFIMLILRFTALRRVCDRCEEYWYYPKVLSRHYIQACLSLFFLQGIVGFGATALMMNFSISESISMLLSTTESYVNALLSAVTLAENMLQFAIEEAHTLTESIPAVLEAGTEVFTGALLEERLNELQSNVDAVNETIRNVEDEIQGVLDIVNKYSIILYAVLAIIIFISMMGPILLAWFSLLKNTCGRVCSLLIFLIPLMLCWILLGAAVLVGAAVGDSCDMIQSYQQYILYSSGVVGTVPSSDNNQWIESHFECPKLSANFETVFNENIAKVQDIELLIESLTGISPETLNTAIDEIKMRVDTILDCTIIVKLLEQIRSALCSSDSNSLVYAVLLLYLGYIIMSFFLTFQFFAALFGMNMNQFAAVWPIWWDDERQTYAYGDVKTLNREQEPEAEPEPEPESNEGVHDLGVVQDTGYEDPNVVREEVHEPGYNDHDVDEGYANQYGHDDQGYAVESGVTSPQYEGDYNYPQN